MKNDGWRDTRFGDVTLNFDSIRVPVKEADRRTGKYPYYGASGVIDHVEGYLFDGTYLLVAEDGANLLSRSTPIAVLAHDKFWVNNHAHIIQGNGKDALTEFLCYWLAENDISGFVTGSAQPKLTQDALNRIPINIPSLAIQREICRILGTLDDKIELNRRMNHSLEALARALFQSWFVDFDPVTAKAAGRQPIGMSAETAAFFPDSFEESSLGQIPKGWKAGRLGDIANLLNGFAFSSRDWIDNGVPVVKIGSVKPGIVDLTNVSYVAEAIADNANRFRLRTADLLIGMTGYVGEVGLVPPTTVRPLLNQRVGKFILEEEGTKALAFIYCLTRDPEFKANVESKAYGTAQANISSDDILSISTVVPDVITRGEFNRLFQPIMDRILANTASSHHVASLRDALLPRLLSAELRVKDAERLAESA